MAISNTTITQIDTNQAIEERLAQIQAALQEPAAPSGAPKINVHLPEDLSEVGICESCQ